MQKIFKTFLKNSFIYISRILLRIVFSLYANTCLEIPIISAICVCVFQKADLCLGSCLLRLYPAGIRPQLLAEKFRHEKKPQ